MARQTIAVSILADAAGVRKGVGEAEGLLGRLTRSVGRVGPAFATALVGGGVVVGLKSVVDAASNAQQSIGATEQIYGKYADSVISKSKAAATTVGLSANTYRELSNGLGAMLKNSGTPMDQLSTKSDGLIKRAADMAATFGGSTKDALESISSLMRGEADPIERYGVSIKQSDVNARLAAKGLDHLTGKGRKQAEATARLELLYKQTGTAQGQFGRESNTFAGQTARLGAKLENLKAKVGTALLPALTRAATFASDTLVPAISRLGPVFTTAGGVVRSFGSAIGATAGFLSRHSTAIKVTGAIVTAVFLPAMIQAGTAMVVQTARTVTMNAAWLAYGIVTKAQALATTAMTGAQWLLNAAMSANPIGLIVIGLAALVGGLVYAYTHSDRFRAIVDAAFSKVRAIATSVFPVVRAVIVTAFRVASTYVRVYVGVIRAVLGGISGTVRAVVGFFGNMVSGVRSKVGGLVSYVKGIPGKIKSGLGDAKSMLTAAGRQIIEGLIGGIKAMAGKAVDAAKGVVSGAVKGAKKLLGIASPSKVFHGIGRNTMDGLIGGIEARRTAVTDTLGRVARGVAQTTFTAPGLALGGPSLAFAATSPASGGTTIINVNVTLDSSMTEAEMGRSYHRAIEAAKQLGMVRP